MYDINIYQLLWERIWGRLSAARMCAGHLFAAEQRTSHGGLPDTQGHKDDGFCHFGTWKWGVLPAVNPIPVEFPMDHGLSSFSPMKYMAMCGFDTAFSVRVRLCPFLDWWIQRCIVSYQGVLSSTPWRTRLTVHECGGFVDTYWTFTYINHGRDENDGMNIHSSS